MPIAGKVAIMGIFDNQVALVAGGGAGIGAAAARLLASRGAMVVVSDVVKSNAEQISQEINSAGGKSVARELNVADQQAVAQFIDSITKEFGRLDAVVNSAGIVGPTNTPIEK